MSRSTEEPYKKAFRVRGIPHGCKRSETAKIIKTALGLEDEEVGLEVCSVAFNPYREAQEKVATIRFASVPNSLSAVGGKDEWRFPLARSEVPEVSDEDDDEDTPHRDVQLVFDTHFKGFTSLRSFRNTSDHKIEYVVFP